MEPQGSRASAPVPDEACLAELVKSIRAGVADAHVELRRIFYPGACFLIRRRLGRQLVDSHVQSVLDAVSRRIREDISIDGRSLPGLVRQTIALCVPTSPAPKLTKNGADQPALMIAAEILQSLSPVERDALRRCYVQGEPPDTFLNTLRMTRDEFRALRLRARNEFSIKTHQTNVA